MRFFFIAILVITGICTYFWLTDPAGSGMGIPTAISATIGLGVGAHNWIRFGSPLRESRPNTTA